MLKIRFKTVCDVSNIIKKCFVVFQNSYGNTTRLKILKTIKKIQFHYTGILVLGQTRAQRQLTQK